MILSKRQLGIATVTTPLNATAEQPQEPTTAPPRTMHPANVIIHYHRPDGEYGDPTSGNYHDFWGLHIWTGAAKPTEWQQPLAPAGRDEFGIYFVIPIRASASELAYILHRGEQKDPGSDQYLQLTEGNNELWLVANPAVEQGHHLPTTSGNIAGGDLSKQCAHWLTADTIAWEVEHQEGMEYTLHTAPQGGLAIENGVIVGGKSLPLRYLSAELTPSLKGKFPHLTHYQCFQLEKLDHTTLTTLLQGQLIIAATLEGIVVNATGLQLPGVLDDLFEYDGALGALVTPSGITLRLWAPTAQQVDLFLFDDAISTRCHSVPMQRGPQGTWECHGDRSWLDKYYLYEVAVYVPESGKVEHNLVTDPYSLGLATNGSRSLIVDLTDPALQPLGWQQHRKPRVDAPTDIVLYELHLRDFSINDQSVPKDLRGKYGAFTVADSAGMRHLQRLVAAGLTHLHLLPVFDFLSVDEDPTARREPTIPLDAAPDSDAQANAIKLVRDVDGFNWGYDPHHYTVPDGAYATTANGTARIIEFREMIQALHEMGLSVVMDVVYNHTHDGGQDPHSVLDKIVPGYYHRLNAEGGIERSTCCANTATEHAMMEKLMLDSLQIWAEQYQLDGFRFDLMGHHMKANMVKARAMLDEIDPAIYIYGEGWDFGEVMHNARGVNATQFNLAGTGIGTFNDRLRNAVRGGRPFDSGDELIANQGFINGLWYAHNAKNWGHDWERAALLSVADQIRVGLAGNLADYTFEAANGHRTRGREIDYYGGPTGYNETPQENVVYVEAHDNQTLYDNNVYKLPLETSLADRVRVQTLGLALTILAQGVPFLHAGSELLRSKSLERDSYNSGDWFNRLFFDYSANNFGVGLPVEAGFESELMRPLLANPALRADQAAIEQCAANVLALLAIRKSSPLFRLRTKADVLARVAFHNTGPNQIPGLIVMSISDEIADLPRLDPNHKLIVVAFNATTHTQQFQKFDWQGMGLTLHPALHTSGDATVLTAAVDDDHGTLTVPARTVAVFVS